MENDIKEISLRNYLDVLNGLVYGTLMVSYANNDVRAEVISAIEIINKISGLEIVREEAHVEGWEDEVIDGVYDIVYTDRHNPMLQITEDDLNVNHYVKDACENKTLIKLKEVNHALYKHVRKLCKDFGVKFETDGKAIVLDGRKKSQSVYKQIQEAYKAGQASIAFDIEEINAPTVRTYSSQFGSAMGLKIRCSTMPGYITVHFKEADPKDIIIGEISGVFRKAVSAGFSEGQIQDMVMSAEGIVFYTDEPISGQAWQDHTLQMENEFSKFSAGVADGLLKKYSEGQNHEQEVPEYAQAGFDNESDYLDYLSEAKQNEQTDIIKEVEGLQQYVLPIADAEPKKPSAEYDDF